MKDTDYVIIDRETMKFVGRASSLEAASIIANEQIVDSHFVMFTLELKSSFSKFGVLELILLYKNTTGQAPSNGIHEYGKLIHDCYHLAVALPVDQRSIFELEKIAAALPKPAPNMLMPKLPPILVRMDPNAPAYSPAASEPKAPKAPSGVKPSSKGSTGRVWEVADRVRAEMGGGPVTKEMRSKIIAACGEAGINEGTAATQYGKWKATQS